MLIIPDGKFEKFRKRKLSRAALRRLAEWEGIDALCKNNPSIIYIPRKFNEDDLPVEYEIIYKVRSVIGVKSMAKFTLEHSGESREIEAREPIFGEEHRMRIIIPNNYPSALGNAIFTFTSNVWHPNIKWSGDQKGHVCQNDRELGVGFPLAKKIVRVGMYLQYQIYHALQTPPYPEDNMVAEWVVEEAEPMGWINKEDGVFTDYKSLMAKAS